MVEAVVYVWWSFEFTLDVKLGFKTLRSTQRAIGRLGTKLPLALLVLVGFEYWFSMYNQEIEQHNNVYGIRYLWRDAREEWNKDNKFHIAIRYPRLCLCYNDEVYWVLGFFSWFYYLNWTGTNPSIHLFHVEISALATVLQDASPGLDEVDDARTIDRDVLFCDHLDNLLCDDTTEQRRCVR